MAKRLIESLENKAIRVAVRRSLGWDAYRQGFASIKEYESFHYAAQKRRINRILGGDA